MKKISKSLSSHLSKITELVSRLENADSNIFQIDVDILLDELRKMYDTVYRINKDQKTENEELRQEETTAEREKDEGKTAEMPMTMAEAVLAVDNTTEVVFADEPVKEESKKYENSQPSLEELEGQPNDELFEEQTSEEENTATDAEHDKSEVLQNDNTDERSENAEHEQPQTLWDKLQDAHTATTIAEKIGAPKSISDLLEEKATENGAQEAAHEGREKKNDEQPQSKPSVRQESEEHNTENPPQPSLFDYFKSSQQEKPVQRTLADSLGTTDTQHKTVTNKVKDLRTIININDKFSFMNELFHNNMKGYNDFILYLNTLDDREEALTYVNSIAEQYGWDNESMTVKTFYSIFDRKF